MLMSRVLQLDKGKLPGDLGCKHCISCTWSKRQTALGSSPNTWQGDGLGDDSTAPCMRQPLRQVSVIVPVRKSTVNVCPRIKSSPNTPSMPALGGKVCPSTAKLVRSCPNATILCTETWGTNSTPLPVVTWIRSGTSAGS